MSDPNASHFVLAFIVVGLVKGPIYRISKLRPKATTNVCLVLFCSQGAELTQSNLSADEHVRTFRTRYLSVGTAEEISRRLGRPQPAPSDRRLRRRCSFD